MTLGALVQGKRTILTGCVANIGLATADLFAENGAALTLVDADPNGAQTARRINERGGNATFVQADVSDASSVEMVCARVADQMGGIDILLNNAGVQRAGRIVEYAEDDWNRTMEVNARSCFLFAKYAVPHLEDAGGGAIVNMASLAGVHGVAGMGAYCASKGAIVALTRSLAVELASSGIRVNALCPGFIESPFNEPVITFMGGAEALKRNVAADVPLGRQGLASEVATVFLFLASDLSSYVTGQAIVVDGGITA